MNILIIGKYPPIQGGVSSKQYWLTKKLSEEFNIDILTNSFEVESKYRMDLSLFNKNYNHNNKITIYSTNNFYLPRFIPKYNPIDIKLINKGITLFNNKKYDLIIGDYLLPYGFVANYLSKKYNVPYILGHAGSDMTRILNSPHYFKILSRVIKEANGIITVPGGKKLFNNLISDNHILEAVYGVPVKYFQEYKNIQLDAITDLIQNNDCPTYIHTGKITKQKGLFELVNAFSKVNFKYNLIFVGDGQNKADLEKYIIRKKISAKFIDFVPPWIMPKLLSQSKYFLSVECNFGVDIHSPGAFYEAMSVGSVCILSNQLKNLPNFENTYITINPLDIKDYTKKLNYSNQIAVENYQKMSKNSMDKINNNNFELGVIQRSNFFKEIVNGYKKI